MTIMGKENPIEKHPPLIWRAIRYVLWLGRRKVWQAMRLLGFTPPAEAMLGHPLDKKVGLQLAEGVGGARALVICDFAAFPLSYDIVVFLAVADNFRRRCGCACMDVVFIAHDSDPFMREAFATNPVNNPQSYRNFIHNLGIEATRLFEAIGDVHFFTNRSTFESFWRKAKSTHRQFPEGYTPYRPSYLPERHGVPYYGMRHLFTNPSDLGEAFSVRPPASQLDLAEAWIGHHAGGRKAITITLRETPHQPERNSNIDAWRILVDQHRDENIVFIILRDFNALYTESPIIGENVIECPEAVLNMSFRAALYEKAHLNLFTGNGPVMLCLLNRRTRYLVFKASTDAASARPEEIYFQHGIRPGENVPGATPFQKLIWQDDEPSVLCRELDDMLDKIAMM
ncbi:MAG: hypothetical protein HQ513_16695 [Rhodospirillales bacterium]|nr:hypothetical protein [Rhodospirillales bacterium]